MLITEINSKQKFSFPCIYRITNLVNGKIYIGQAQDLNLRFRQYRKGRFTPLMMKAVKKYGIDKFVVDVLERVEISQLDEREQYYLDKLKPFDGDVGYNICRFAMTTRGRKRPKKEIEGTIAYRKSCVGPKNSFYGKKHTDQAIEKMRKAKIGKKLSPEHIEKLKLVNRYNARKKVCQIDPITNEAIRTWDSLKDAADNTSATVPGISSVCHGKLRTSGGYKWEFKTRQGNVSEPQT